MNGTELEKPANEMLDWSVGILCQLAKEHSDAYDDMAMLVDMIRKHTESEALTKGGKQQC